MSKKKRQKAQPAEVENPSPRTPPPPQPSGGEGSDFPHNSGSSSSSSYSDKDLHSEPPTCQPKARSDSQFVREDIPTGESFEPLKKQVVAGLPAMHLPSTKPAALLAAASRSGKRSEEADTEDAGKQQLQLFQRVFSDEDEIAILKGMISYSEKYCGADPKSNASDFLTFIKGSLSVEVDPKQVLNKIRNLKKRYMNSVMGKRKSIAGPHEREALELSKKIWKYDEDDEIVKREKKKIKKVVDVEQDDAEGCFNNNVAAPEDIIDDDVQDELPSFGKSCISMGMDEFLVRQGLPFVEESDKLRMSNKWKQLKILEIELYQRKLSLVRETGKMILNALQSSS